MRLFFNIKPTIITGWGTTFHAHSRVRQSIIGCFTCSSQFGYAYTDSSRGDTKYVYGYNIEVFKRGKHRNNKHYVVYLYKFPIEMFKMLNVEINQHRNRFTIKHKNK